MMALYHLGAPANQAYDQASEGSMHNTWTLEPTHLRLKQSHQYRTNSTYALSAMTSQHVCYKLHFEKKKKLLLSLCQWTCCTAGVSARNSQVF